jgi:hypothetical protein
MIGPLPTAPGGFNRVLVAIDKFTKWIKELPNALWGLRTQPTKPTGQSPYFLVYGSEAILPADVMWDSPAVEQYDKGISEDSRRVDIDGLEEARCAALVQSARYLEGIRRYHDRNIKERSFNVGDLVLRHIQNTEGLHKLNSPWEGPFSIAKVTRPGSYASKHLKATTSATRGTSTSSVDSTHSLSTTLRESKSIRLPPGSSL